MKKYNWNPREPGQSKSIIFLLYMHSTKLDCFPLSSPKSPWISCLASPRLRESLVDLSVRSSSIWTLGPSRLATPASNKTNIQANEIQTPLSNH